MSNHDTIQVKGAREHNLKNVDLTIPKDKLVVFTGVSGSGKSSMAFDTIFAEGQRRYVESLSSYARQFLGVMGKPNVDSITGLSPSISIDQKTSSQNPRSTVGTTTEIYDYMRLLYARVGHPFCPNCGREITKLSVDEIVDSIIDVARRVCEGSRQKPHSFIIASPVVQSRKGTFVSLFDNLRSKGFLDVLIDGKRHSLDDDIGLIKTNTHTIDVIIDVFNVSHKNYKDEVFVSNLRSRVFASVEQGLTLSDGSIRLDGEGNTSNLFSEQFSCSHCNIALPELEPRMFSFNSPLGACQTCKGLGTVQRVDPKLVLNENLSIREGGIIPYARLFANETWHMRFITTVLEDLAIDQTVPISKVNKQAISILMSGNGKEYTVKGKNRFGRDTVIHETFKGIIQELEERYTDAQTDFARYEIEKYMSMEVCRSCKGKRLGKEALAVKVGGINIYDLCEKSIEDCHAFVQGLTAILSEFENIVAKELLTEIQSRLAFLKNVGLSYLTLNRSARTLSGGESQRIRLASQIGSGLTGVIYVLDEPSIGLHARDVSALLKSLTQLRDLGNTVLIVEHDPETIRYADHVVDFGPKAGRDGGQVVFEGSLSDLLHKSNTLTSHYLRQSIHLHKDSPGTQSSTHTPSMIRIFGCSQFNLKNINFEIPVGKLTCVTGVSGSGKSTLVVETFYKALKYHVEGTYSSSMGEYKRIEGHEYIDKIYLVDQSPIGRTPRSNPVTYVGAFDFIRDIFAQTQDARAQGYKKGRFSFNVKGGRCEKCMGAGTLKIEMQFLPDVYVTCDVCNGLRYNSETLLVRYKGKTIYDILAMTVEEAMSFFASHAPVANKLKSLIDVGLGYIELGQPAPTLSGGEAQRIKLAAELSKRESGRTLYILDEPTTGLHLYDVEKLLHALYKLQNRGNTVVLIEHNLDVIRNSQHVIDMGPEGGEGGGSIVFSGSVDTLMKCDASYTGRYLRDAVHQTHE